MLGTVKKNVDTHQRAWTQAEVKIQTAKADENDLLALDGTDACRLQDVTSLLGLTALRSISLGNNSLRYFPNAVLDLPSLRSLNLEGNAIETIPLSITRIVRLADLDLSCNALNLVDGQTSGCTDVLPALFGMEWISRIVLRKNAIGAGWQQKLLEMGANNQVTVLMAGCSETPEHSPSEGKSDNA